MKCTRTILRWIDDRTRKFFDEKKMANLRYPTQLPCSQGFLQICDNIKTFILQFYRFSEGFAQQSNEMDDLLRKVGYISFSSFDFRSQLIISCFKPYAVVLLRNSTIADFRKPFKLSSTSSTCNLPAPTLNSFFRRISMSINFISTSFLRYSHRGSQVTLQAITSFKNARGSGETRIIDIAIEKIDSYFQKLQSNFNW
jgi:hypothetical protein